MPKRTRRRDASIDVDRLRQDYLEHLDVLDEAATKVRDAMDSAASALDVIRVHVRAGGNISDFAGLLDPIPLRNELSVALHDLERARHRGQQFMFRILQAEGRSTADIARVWGISRQLVSRLVNEPLEPRGRSTRK
jgi:hypothetical protein